MRIYLCISDYKKCTTQSSLFVLIYGTVYYDYCVLAAHTCIVCIDVWFSMVSTISPLSPLPKNRDWSTRYLQVHVWTITIKSSFMTIFKFSLYVNLVKKICRSWSKVWCFSTLLFLSIFVRNIIDFRIWTLILQVFEEWSTILLWNGQGML